MINFITQGTLSEKKDFCKIHNFCNKCNLPYGYFNGKELTLNKDGVITEKKALEKEKGVYLYSNLCCHILRSKVTSLAEAAEEVGENFDYEKEV